ncbi:MAG: hypothetical protein ACR2NA_14050 [Solirubrobacterales bacterium]
MGALLFPIRWLFYRFTPFGRLLLLSEAVLSLRRSYTRLESGERRELLRIVRASKGMPSKVSSPERAEVRRILGKARAARSVRLGVWFWRPLRRPRG